MNSPRIESVVFTNTARCRDCWRCVRVCPVKAIAVHDGQAAVVADRCISCGSCIRECPQNAKAYRNDVEGVKALLMDRENVAISLAPSFAAFYSPVHYQKLPTALRLLGFSFVAETAVGAYHSALASREWISKHRKGLSIGSACPAVVRYVELYRPELTEHLIDVPSPMALHADLCRKRLGKNSGFVFVGPCVAKKYEAGRDGISNLVDFALTFEELDGWMASEKIDLSALADSHFDELPGGSARLYPLAGGMLKTADLPTDMLSCGHTAVSGFENLKDALSACGDGQQVVEALFCRDGCINGPAKTGSYTPVARRQNLIRYYERRAAYTDDSLEWNGNDGDPGSELQFAGTEISELEIQTVLEATGHADEVDQLNCAACGYNSCRDRAVAVVLGLAERDMCIPFMRRLAEQRSDRIMESSPNGIVILDSHLNILFMNPTFQRFFKCFNSSAGRRINFLMDPGPFEKLTTGETDMVEMTVNHKRFGLVCHQICYTLKDEGQYVGIFVNITGQLSSEEKLATLRAQTVSQVRELFAHQLSVAEQLAGFLGESTARGEVLVDTLLKLADEDSDERTTDGGRLWNIFTSK